MPHPLLASPAAGWQSSSWIFVVSAMFRACSQVVPFCSFVLESRYECYCTTIGSGVPLLFLVNLVEASHLYEAPTAELRSWDPEPDLEGKRAWGALGFRSSGGVVVKSLEHFGVVKGLW